MGAKPTAADPGIQDPQHEVRDQVADDDHEGDDHDDAHQHRQVATLKGRDRERPDPGDPEGALDEDRPAKARPTSMPTMAMIGRKALRNVWRRSVPHSERPLARAVRT